MSKIIIHNNSKQSDVVAVQMVSNVISKGFVSGPKQYCWTTEFPFGARVIAQKTRGDTHTFKVKDVDK